MKNKVISTGSEARERLLQGANFLANIVQSTIGPNGQNFLIDKGLKITNDGKNIAAEIEHPDEISNQAIKLLREAGIKTEQEVFDASSSSVALGRAIMVSCSEQLPRAGIVVGKMTPSEVFNKVKSEVAEIDAKLVEMAIPVTDEQTLIEVAHVSTENKPLAELIGKTQWKLGPKGVLVAEETIDDECSVEIVKGILIDNGLASSNVMNNLEKQSLEVKNIPILLTEHTINDMGDFSELIEKLSKNGITRIVLMGGGYTELAIKGCTEYTKAGFTIFPVNAPFVNRKEVLRDLSAVLGGHPILIEETSLTDIKPEDLGFAEYITVERHRAIFTGKDDNKSKERIAVRIKEIEESLKSANSQFEKQNKSKRLAQLESGFGIIKVGSPVDTDRKRLKDKADDAVGTVRMALLEGVVPGAGQAYKIVSDELSDSYLLKKPLLCIYEQIIASSPKDFVIEEWVKDPVKTLRVMLKYASLVGSNLATVSGVSAIEKDKPRYIQEVSNQEND